MLSPATQTHTLARTIDSGDILQNLSGIGIVDVWAIHPSLPQAFINTGNGTVCQNPNREPHIDHLHDLCQQHRGVGEHVVDPDDHRAAHHHHRWGPEPTFVRTETITPIELNTTGGVIDTWEISASLPDGLDFDASNGTITGTPTTNLTSTTWTIWPTTQVARTASSSLW